MSSRMRKSGAKRDQQSVFVSKHREHRDKVQKIDNFRKKKRYFLIHTSLERSPISTFLSTPRQNHAEKPGTEKTILKKTVRLRLTLLPSEFQTPYSSSHGWEGKGCTSFCRSNEVLGSFCHHISSTQHGTRDNSDIFVLLGYSYRLRQIGENLIRSSG